MEKIALVTGAYKGLGLEFCKQLVNAGYKVILTAREIQKAQAAAETLNVRQQSAIPKALEVTDEIQIKNLAS